MNEDKASRYHRQRRCVALASLAWTVACLVTLLVSGASRRLSDLAFATSATWSTGGSRVAAWWLYVLGLLAVHEVGSLVVAYKGGFLLERRYGLSTQSARRWWVNRAKSFLLSFLVSGVSATIVYGAMSVTPSWWWLLSGGLFAMLLVSIAELAPVVLLPVFYRIRPLARESLRSRLLALADRAGTRVLGAYEWGISAESSRANAALTGLGSSRRILVSDTMLTDYSDDEIEVVLAHEMAHHVHGDLWKALCFEVCVLLAGLFVAARGLSAWHDEIGLHSVGDVAGLPLVLLLVGGVSLLAVPLAHAWSRARERDADRYAITLTGNPAAFVSAMRRLGAQNMAEESPSIVVRWLFHSHPTFAERIALAQARRQ